MPQQRLVNNHAVFCTQIAARAAQTQATYPAVCPTLSNRAVQSYAALMTGGGV